MLYILFSLLNIPQKAFVELWLSNQECYDWATKHPMVEQSSTLCLLNQAARECLLSPFYPRKSPFYLL